jgi:hypothetical protein
LEPKYKITRNAQTIIGLNHHLIQFACGDEFYLDDLFLRAFEAGQENRPPEEVADEYDLKSGELEVLKLGLQQLDKSCNKKPDEQFQEPDLNIAPLPLNGNLPLVSVVIVSYNGRKYLPECLESIERQMYPSLEIIVVDNGSQDNSADFVENQYPDITLIRLSRNLGYSGGTNVGIKAAHGELLFLLNMDTRLEKHCIANAVSVMQNADGKCFSVFPKVLFYDYPRFLNAFGCVWHHQNLWVDNRAGMLDTGSLDRVEQTFGSIFVALLIKKKLFDEIGGFDDFHFSYAEDFDVSYRANSAGYYSLLSPASILWHKHRSAAVEPLCTNLFLRNFPVMMIKNLELKKLVVRTGYMWRRFLLHPLIYPGLKNKNYRQLLAALQIVLSITKNIPHILKWRWRIQRRRTVPDLKLWNFNSLLPYNIFYYNHRIVLNIANLRASLRGNIDVDVDGQRFTLW